MNTIPKVIIFVDSINKGIALIEYLYTKLSDNLKDKINEIIWCFYSNLSNRSRKLFAEDFFWRNIYIWVYTKIGDLGINILNFLHII